MYTCPACQKTHEEDKFYCDCCEKYYCSLECLQYKNFPEHDERGVRYMTDLKTSCCDSCCCAKCFTRLLYIDVDQSTLVCDMCEKYFHDTCDCYLENGNETCMCRLCIDLKNDEKKYICKPCHEKHNVEPLDFFNLFDVENSNSPEWKNLVSRQYFGKRVKDKRIMIEGYRKDYTGFDFSDCKKFEKLSRLLDPDYPLYMFGKSECKSDDVNQDVIEEILNYGKSEGESKFKAFIRKCSNCTLIECNCEFCKNVKCNTLLFRLMFYNSELNDISNGWDTGNDFTPIEILKSIAERPDNACNCDICRFWKAYD